MSKKLGLGKLSKEDFNRLVRPHIPTDKIELDGATVPLTDQSIIAHNPSIGVPIEALGFFAFHYSASNVACKFGTPTNLIIGIYLPLGTSESDLVTIAKVLGGEASKYGVKITAGQTGTYYGLEIPLLTATCIGKAVRKSRALEPSDKVLIVNEIGGESIWLKELSEGKSRFNWRQFTPLPTILALHEVDSVKMMHDVSEGGVKGSLLEIVEDSCIRIDFSSKYLVYARGSQEINSDVLRGPSYGTLIVISEQNGANHIITKCSQLGIHCVIAGEISKGHGLFINETEIKPEKRIDLDELYGSFYKTRVE
ncbi:AIR synthase-related protein [Thermoproteota archaeon]